MCVQHLCQSFTQRSYSGISTTGGIKIHFSIWTNTFYNLENSPVCKKIYVNHWLTHHLRIQEYQICWAKKAWHIGWKVYHDTCIAFTSNVHTSCFIYVWRNVNCSKSLTYWIEGISWHLWKLKLVTSPASYPTPKIQLSVPKLVF